MALWLKIQANIATHQKMIEAGPVASWLWLAGVGHARANETDGFIPKLVVPGLVPGMKGAFKHAAALVKVGLWHDVEGGYQVNGFLEWNPSKADLEDQRRQDRDRKKGKFQTESDRNPSGVQSEPSRARGYARSHSVSALSSSEVVNSEKSARETTAVVRPMAWNESYHVRNCPPWAIRSACRRGICIPKYLWPQWEARLDGPSEAASASLRMFCEQVLAQTPPRPGDRAEDFWPAHFAAHFGTSAPSVQRPGKAGRTVSAIDAAAAQLRGQG